MHRILVNFVDADGRSIMPGIDIPVQVTMPTDSHFLTRNFIINIQQLKFENAGPYSIDLLVDGTVQAGIPLLVRQMPKQAS